ncbi:MAG TPA: DUF378 domain-containing protein [Sedimentisphaerales bacterium]|nr:DUF378 domain-containing protein [Sedimentisphaerales bacterium]
MKSEGLKMVDCVVGALVLIGALNWGLVGLFDFDVVARIFGPMTAASRLVYTVVGLAALYDILTIKAIWHRWDIHFRRPVQA